MKFIIGVTRKPEKIKKYLTKYHAKAETLTEIGPFLSSTDAFNWLVYVKSRIGDFEEIYPEMRYQKDCLWYGFTFEQDKSKAIPKRR